MVAPVRESSAGPCLAHAKPEKEQELLADSEINGHTGTVWPEHEPRSPCGPARNSDFAYEIADAVTVVVVLGHSAGQ